MTKSFNNDQDKQIITSDVLGSYTGRPDDAGKYAEPEQDADDL